MIASSTTRPMASTRPIRVSVLIENPKAAIRANVATSATGMATMGISVVRNPWRKTKTTMSTSPNASTQGMLDLVDVLLDVLGGVEGDPVLQVGREVLGQPVHLAA